MGLYTHECKMAFTSYKSIIQPVPPKKGAYQEKIVEPLGQFSEGFAKGGLSTLKGLGTIGQTILDQTAGRVVSAVQGKGFTPLGPEPGSLSNIYRKGTEEEKRASEFLTPQGVAQEIGFGTEKFAEFLIPATKAAKVEGYVGL